MVTAIEVRSVAVVAIVEPVEAIVVTAEAIVVAIVDIVVEGSASASGVASAIAALLPRWWWPASASGSAIASADLFP